jgi:release factor glutamine methyltransferase
VTVLEVIQRSSEFLTRKGVDSPRLHVELLLGHVLQVPRLKLYLNFERALTDAELDMLRTLVKRRGDREPLQHIVGSTSFCGLEITVNRDVLIPRPETEQLAEQACILLKTPRSKPANVLDFGTGSGCLAIAIAHQCPDAIVHALDISSAALSVAQANVTRHGLEGRIQFHNGNGFPALPSGLCFDLLVANPPYIPTAEIDTLQPEVRDHDPHQALDGGPDGLAFYRSFAGEGASRMKSSGIAMLEFGDGQEAAVQEIFCDQGWVVDAVVSDYSHRPRILIAHRP